MIKDKLKIKEKNFKKVRGQYCHGSFIFTDGQYFFSKDRDQHKGGYYKVAKKITDLGSKSRRLGTYDINFNRIGK